jgi:hypothetical protein
MGAYYIKRTFADGVKGGISLSYAEIVRPFVFGSNWKRVRIGVQIAYNDYNTARSVTGVRLDLGVCCGNLGYMHPSGRTTNYVGHNMYGNNGLWNVTNVVAYNTNSGNPYFSYSAELGSYMTLVGTTLTATSVSSGGQPSVPNTYGSVQRRCPVIIEITKGTSSVTMHSECSQSAAQMSIACPSSEFLELVESSGAVAPASYGFLIQGGSVAMTTALESNGPYDSFSLAYGCNNLELEVYELIAMRLN